MTSRSEDINDNVLSTEKTPNLEHPLSDHERPAKKQKQDVPTFLPPASKHRSIWWRHYMIYNPVKTPDKEGIAICNYCFKDVKYIKGITGLQTHIKCHHAAKLTDIETQANKKIQSNKLALIKGLRAVPNPNKKTKQDRLEECIVAWVVDECIPFNAVEKKSFRRMISTLDSSILPIPASSIRKKVAKKGEICKESLQMELKGKYISLTTDHWTSVNGETYACLTAHYIASGQYKKCLLSFEVHKGTTTGETMGKQFLEQFENFKLDLDQVVSVTTDTASNMNIFGKVLESKGVAHIYCTAHNLHLLAKKAYDDSNLPGAEQPMKAARKLVAFFNQSSQAQANLLTMQEILFPDKPLLKPIQDVVTRWWSTYSMLERLLGRLHQAMVSLKNSKSHMEFEPLNETQIKVLKEVQEILKPISKAQKKLEGDKYSTASIVPIMIDKIRKVLKLSSEAGNENFCTASKSLARVMLTDLERNRYGDGERVTMEVKRGARGRQIAIHPYIWVATALDPSMKTLPSLSSDYERQKIWDYILTLMVEEKQKQLDLQTLKAGEKETEEKGEEKGEDAENEESDDDYFQVGDYYQDDGALEEVDVSCRDELNSYQQQRLKKSESKKCPALWWEDNKALFPVLFELSLKFLAIPATSAPSERIWSISARYLTKLRSQLKPEIVASMIFLKENGHILKKHYEDLTKDQGAILPGIYDDLNEKPNRDVIEMMLKEMAGEDVDFYEGGL